MTWRKSFARNARFNDLPSLGAFRIENAPEPLGKGKFRVMLTCKDGTRAQLTTFEGTIGDMLAVGSDEDWIEAYEEKVDKDTYIRFRKAKVK